jgi:argininosuccinate synthase
MATRLVVACLGDPRSFTTIAQARECAGTEVVAVAFDLGIGVSLAALKADALAAGATRCHALDVREEFARDVIVPAARDWSSTVAEGSERFGTVAAAFVNRLLQSMAALEDGCVSQPIAIPRYSGSSRHHTFGPARLTIGFEAGAPIAINGVRMTLTELVESIETITGRPALEILAQAYHERHVAEIDDVTFEILEGRCTPLTAVAVGR